MTSTDEYVRLTESHDFGSSFVNSYDPECDTHVGPAGEDDEHTFNANGVLVVGCQGYWLHDPALFGLDRGQWSDWKPDALAALSDVDVWIELTLADLAVYDELDENGDTARFTQDELIKEIDRRWGPDALDRVSTVITGGKFTADEELRWLRSDDAKSFMQLVRGERTPESFNMYDSYGN